MKLFKCWKNYVYTFFGSANEKNRIELKPEKIETWCQVGDLNWLLLSLFHRGYKLKYNGGDCDADSEINRVQTIDTIRWIMWKSEDIKCQGENLVGLGTIRN